MLNQDIHATGNVLIQFCVLNYQDSESREIKVFTRCVCEENRVGNLYLNIREGCKMTLTGWRLILNRGK